MPVCTAHVCLSTSLYVCLSVCLPACLSVCLSVSLSPVCLSVFMSFSLLSAINSFSKSECCVYLYVCLSASLFFCLLSVCLSIYLSVCLSVRLSPYLSVNTSVCLYASFTFPFSQVNTSVFRSGFCPAADTKKTYYLSSVGLVHLRCCIGIGGIIITFMEIHNLFWFCFWVSFHYNHFRVYIFCHQAVAIREWDLRNDYEGCAYIKQYTVCTYVNDIIYHIQCREF